MADSSIMALDVGEARIGVAVANRIARLARPLTTVANDSQSLQSIQALCRQEDAGLLVVGLPRGLDGQETAQTKRARDFAGKLEEALQLPVQLQDEAVTSVQAEAELETRGKPYSKSDIDALAATYILEDYLREHL